MADDVERLLLLGDPAEVEIAVDDRLLAAAASATTVPSGAKIVVPRGAEADAAWMKSSAAPIASGSSKPSGRAPAVMLAPLHADREAAALERIVAAREAVYLRIADLGQAATWISSRSACIAKRASGIQCSQQISPRPCRRRLDDAQVAPVPRPRRSAPRAWA